MKKANPSAVSARHTFKGGNLREEGKATFPPQQAHFLVPRLRRLSCTLTNVKLSHKDLEAFPTFEHGDTGGAGFMPTGRLYPCGLATEARAEQAAALPCAERSRSVKSRCSLHKPGTVRCGPSRHPRCHPPERHPHSLVHPPPPRSAQLHRPGRPLSPRFPSPPLSARPGHSPRNAERRARPGAAAQRPGQAAGTALTGTALGKSKVKPHSCPPLHSGADLGSPTAAAPSGAPLPSPPPSRPLTRTLPEGSSSGADSPSSSSSS